jgi:hypothetical protein
MHAHGRFVVFARRGRETEPQQITEFDLKLARMAERGAGGRRQMTASHAPRRQRLVHARYRPSGSEKQLVGNG